ncbi:MAG: carbon storage regulator [Chlamydiales bacterium]|nr:carbon storage regulator [Chlamydiales bacterium]
MLVLTRKAEQKIRIGNNIVITVLKVQGDQVSIGIEAPKDLQIVREELLNEDLIKSTARANRKSALYENRSETIAEDFS